MLLSLDIRNVILIEAAEIPLGPGLTVISGETGAGKSLIAQCLQFLSGARMDTTFIRHGADEARVLVKIATSHSDILQAERCLSRSGKGKAMVNGKTVTLSELKSLVGKWIDIASQFDQQRLLDPASHLEAIDCFAKTEVERCAYAEVFSFYEAARFALEQRRLQLTEARTQEEFLRHQLTELKDAKLKGDEEVQLVADRERTRHRAEWESRLQSLEDLISGETGLEKNVSQIIHHLPPPLRESNGPLLDTLQASASELVAIISREMQAFTSAPADLDAIESRLFALHQLMRKYKTDEAGLIVKQNQLKEAIALLDLGDEGLADLESELKRAEEKLKKAGTVLTQKRKAAVKPLCQAIQKCLAEIAMEKATLHVQWQALSPAEATVAGMDAVEFLISPNVGEPLLPLVQIASGGELSRMLLAIKAVLTESVIARSVATKQSSVGDCRGPAGLAMTVPTLFFDEVDTGIGGRVAMAVGSVLKRLAQTTQVLCITHLPQVAAFGDIHYKVEKNERRGRTHTRIASITGKARQEEIARMLAGETLSPTAMAHAVDLLKQAE